MLTEAPRRTNANNVAIGTVYGYWTVKDSYYRKGANNDAYFPCECRCGTLRDVRLRQLNEALKGSGNGSCGCYQKEVMATKRKHGVNPGTKEWDIARRVWTKYRITYDTYLKMVEDQDNLCAICSGSMDPPYVDHCHDTLKVRGLLCHNCNTVLGHAKDNPTILINAAKYLGAIVND
jgi:hypothetical protein